MVIFNYLSDNIFLKYIFKDDNIYKFNFIFNYMSHQLPYAFISVLGGKENPNLELPKELNEPKEEAEFLQKDENMKGYYLGACLDSCRWGSQMTVMWEMSIKDMIGFIQNWMKQNKNNYQELFHEMKINELYDKFELPHIHYDRCPRAKENKEENKGVITDLAGRLRCAHKEIKYFKPNYIREFDFFDEKLKTKKLNIWEDKPYEPSPSYWWELQEEDEEDPIYVEAYEVYEEEMEEFDNEERTLEVLDVCYSIISDKDVILPLEEVLRRVNLREEFVTFHCGGNRFGPCIRLLDSETTEMYDDLDHCPGHLKYNNKFETPFDGWDLAYYVQKWLEQVPDGKVPLFGKI